MGQIRGSEQQRIATVFEFRRYVDFQSWIRTTLPLAYELERLAPSLASDGPNPEYPWPHSQPVIAPAGYRFPFWGKMQTGTGWQLMRVIGIAVNRFSEYSDS